MFAAAASAARCVHRSRKSNVESLTGGGAGFGSGVGLALPCCGDFFASLRCSRAVFALPSLDDAHPIADQFADVLLILMISHAKLATSWLTEVQCSVLIVHGALGWPSALKRAARTLYTLEPLGSTVARGDQCSRELASAIGRAVSVSQPVRLAAILAQRCISCKITKSLLLFLYVRSQCD